MNLLYVANARIPTEKAHGIQIMKMCEAFSNLGINLELVIPKRKIKEDPFVFYGITKRFIIKRLPVIDTYGSGLLGYWLAAFSFAISSFFIPCLNRGDYLFSRS